MKATETEPIDCLIAQLEAQISVSESLGLGLTKLLLSMARLDLQMQRHDIASAELTRLCAFYERKLAPHGPADPPNPSRREAKLPSSAGEPGAARESLKPIAGQGSRSALAAPVLAERFPQSDVSFGRRSTGARKARRR